MKIDVKGLEKRVSDAFNKDKINVDADKDTMEWYGLSVDPSAKDDGHMEDNKVARVVANTNGGLWLKNLYKKYLEKAKIFGVAHPLCYDDWLIKTQSCYDKANEDFKKALKSYKTEENHLHPDWEKAVKSSYNYYLETFPKDAPRPSYEEYKERVEAFDKASCGSVGKKILENYEDAIRNCVPSSAEKYEMVNHPQHYNQYRVEVIDMFEKIYGKEATALWCEMTALKYRMRMGLKPGSSLLEDYEKEQWYLGMKDKLLQ